MEAEVMKGTKRSLESDIPEASGSAKNVCLDARSLHSTNSLKNIKIHHNVGNDQWPKHVPVLAMGGKTTFEGIQ